MRHAWIDFPPQEREGRLSYEWKFRGAWHHVRAACRGTPAPLAPDSLEQFIAEHYWGYCRQRDGGTIEYQVEHPAWKVWRAHESSLSVDAARLYGMSFAEPLSQPPASAFVADGSTVSVRWPNRLC
jgi:hypothetical protein